MNKKIVVFNDFPIFPINHGGKIRTYNIYRRLSERFDVAYVSYSPVKKVEESRISDHFTIVSVPKGAIHRHIVKHCVRIMDYAIDDIVAMYIGKYDRQFCDVARRLIDGADAIVACQPYLYGVIEKYAGDKPVLYESQNVEYLLKRSILGDGLLKRGAIKDVRHTEGALLRRAGAVFATSNDDARQFTAIYGTSPEKMYLSPNGTDLHSYDGIFEGGRARKVKASGPMALFIGSGHPPNAKAAAVLVNEIAPKASEVRFTICGSVCNMMNRSLVGKNVTLAYEVSDEKKLDLMRSADIALNPMLDGSGTNLKMLDYMAAGLPIVATPIGARGLDLENGRHAIICEIGEFPAKIREVLGDGELYETLSIEGRKLADEKYDWGKIAGDMAAVIEKVMGAGPG